MSFRFRKSFKFGPVRYTVSKSGISSSIGGKSFRITKTAKGKMRMTSSIPGTGISYSSQLGSSKKARSGSKPSRRTSTSNSLPTSFEAVGVEYRLDNLMSVSQASRSFKSQDDVFLEKYSDGRKVYKYFFNNSIGALEPEPDNPHDKNAIKVMLDGVHIAYVPAALCLDVSRLLNSGYTPVVKVKGGPFKKVENGQVASYDDDFRVFVDFKNPDTSALPAFSQAATSAKDKASVLVRVVQWIMSAFVMLHALIFMPSVSSLVFAASGLSLMPLSFVNKLFSKVKRPWLIRIPLALLLYFVAIMLTPSKTI